MVKLDPIIINMKTPYPEISFRESFKSNLISARSATRLSNIMLNAGNAFPIDADIDESGFIDESTFHIVINHEEIAYDAVFRFSLTPGDEWIFESVEVGGKLYTDYVDALVATSDYFESIQKHLDKLT